MLSATRFTMVMVMVMVMVIGDPNSKSEETRFVKNH
jgi:hypothetical protein